MDKSKIFFLLPLALAVILSLVAARADQSPAAVPTTPAGSRLQESLDLISTGDAARIQAYFDAAFAPSFLAKFGRDRLFDVYYGFFEKYGGLEFHHAQKSSPHNIVAVHRCRRTDSAFLFGLAVTSKPPHFIQGMTILPMAHPNQPDSLASLTDAEKIERLKRFLDRLAEAEAFSGVVLLARKGDVLFHGASGLADREKSLPNSVGTRFNLASLNKMFTAVAVAKLVEQGKLSWKDPIGKYLGEDWTPREIGQEVRIEHLLSHTSGIGIAKGDDNLAYLEAAVAGKFRRLDDFKPLATGAWLKSKPGSTHVYSNFGVHLLGPIIEKASGETFEEVLRSRVFEPAGMAGTRFLDADQLGPDTAIGYVRELADGGYAWKDNRSRISFRGTPAGCAYATAGDLSKFATALMDGTLVSSKTRDILFAPKKELGAESYGFGFSVRRFGNRFTVGHTGGYIGINNSFAMYPDRGYTVIILSNVDIVSGSAVADIGFYIADLFLGPIAAKAGI